MIDSHCHLDHEPMFSDLENVIIRSKESGVEKILSICTTNDSFKKILEIVKFDPIIYGTFGIHPHETSKYTGLDSNFISDTIKNNKKIIGIGETGLDFYYNHSDKSVQKKIFCEHIDAAANLKIPLIVHTRDAEKETYEILKSENKNFNLKVLIHCFTGTNDFAKKLLDIGCYISLSGIITFKKATDLIKTVENIPIDKLLVETDSPYLSPVPYRGKTNEPSYLKYTVKKLAEIKKISIDEVMNKTSNNFLSIFNL